MNTQLRDEAAILDGPEGSMRSQLVLLPVLCMAYCASIAQELITGRDCTGIL